MTGLINYLLSSFIEKSWILTLLVFLIIISIQVYAGIIIKKTNRKHGIWSLGLSIFQFACPIVAVVLSYVILSPKHESYYYEESYRDHLLVGVLAVYMFLAFCLNSYLIWRNRKCETRVKYTSIAMLLLVSVMISFYLGANYYKRESDKSYYYSLFWENYILDSLIHVEKHDMADVRKLLYHRMTDRLDAYEYLITKKKRPLRRGSYIWINPLHPLFRTDEKDLRDAEHYRKVIRDRNEHEAPTQGDEYQSLKPVYEALSIAIHSAKDDDPSIFKNEQKKILAHFEAKEMFERLAKPTTPTPLPLQEL